MTSRLLIFIKRTRACPFSRKIRPEDDRLNRHGSPATSIPTCGLLCRGRLLGLRLDDATRDAERKRHLTAYFAHETGNLIRAVQGSLALLADNAKRAAECRVTESVGSSAKALAAL